MSSIETRLPPAYPTIGVFLRVTDAVRRNGNEGILANVSDSLIKSVKQLLTPEDLLKAKELPVPEIISLAEHPDFDSLLRQRERIRRLQLLPKKWDAHYASYVQEDINRLTQIAASYIEEDVFAVELNLFPDKLPLDTEGYTIWVRDKNANQEEIARFTAQVMTAWGLGIGDVILFEKPLVETPLIKPSIANLRHIHFWIRAKDKDDNIHRSMYKRVER